jgi:hypothetical protein
VQGQNLLFVGGQGPVGAPALRLRRPDHGAPPWTRNATGRIDVPSRDRWPNSFDAFADATGRLIALGACEITWREGCRLLVAPCDPELVKERPTKEQKP